MGKLLIILALLMCQTGCCYFGPAVVNEDVSSVEYVNPATRGSIGARLLPRTGARIGDSRDNCAVTTGDNAEQRDKDA